MTEFDEYRGDVIELQDSLLRQQRKRGIQLVNVVPAMYTRIMRIPPS